MNFQHHILPIMHDRDKFLDRPTIDSEKRGTLIEGARLFRQTSAVQTLRPSPRNENPFVDTHRRLERDATGRQAFNQNRGSPVLLVGSVPCCRNFVPRGILWRSTCRPPIPGVASLSTFSKSASFISDTDRRDFSQSIPIMYILHHFKYLR